METLQTERLILRRWRSEDLDEYARINADSRVMQYFSAPLSREESRQMIEKIEAHFERYGFGLFAAQEKTDARVIGFIGLIVPQFEAHFTPCVEIGWRLAAEYWNRGLATEGARRVLTHAFVDVGLSEVVSLTTTANKASRRVMEKLGMTRDPADDFDHPKLAPDHPLRRHVLYRIARGQWELALGR